MAVTEEVPVVIIGAGQSGLAAAACLNKLGIPNLILERDDCIGSLWRKRSYDRVSLHLHKRYCQLPHLPHPPTAPTFIPKKGFIAYLDQYAATFSVRTLLSRRVESAEFDGEARRWRVAARNLNTDEEEVYVSSFLVVASGENDGIVKPELPGMGSFVGEVVHSSQYGTGERFGRKAVLVVGCGNSGMEIAYDLACFGAKTSIVVRSPLHVLSKGIWLLGMVLIQYLPCRIVDILTLFLCYLKFGDTSMYGLRRPKEGIFYLKENTPTYPLLDVGTFGKIRSGEIQVLPSIESIKGNSITFADGKLYQFDAIVLATGYKSTIKNWLKSEDNFIGDDGMPRHKFPDHWKGRNGLYTVGLARRGIYGSAEDALLIADDINKIYNANKEK